MRLGESGQGGGEGGMWDVGTDGEVFVCGFW